MRSIAVCLLVVACGDNLDPGGAETEARLASPTILRQLEATRVGEQTRSRVHVDNVGGAPTGPPTVELTGDALAIDPATTCGAPLAPGDGCDVVIAFAPTTVGTFTGTLAISADPGGRVGVDLAGIAGGAILQLSQTEVHFDLAEVGTLHDAFLQLRNDGPWAGAIDELALTASGDFALGHDCGVSLAAGAACSVHVQFLPMELGAASAEIVLRSGSETWRVPVDGSGGYRLTVVATGATGTVTSTPAGIDCTTLQQVCNALFTTDVTLDVTTAATTTVTWSLATCSGMQCVVPARPGPITVTATLSP